MGRRLSNSTLLLLQVTVLCAFASVASYPTLSRAQASAAQHTVTIKVERTTQISLSGDMSTSVKQGSEKTLNTTYSVRTNRPSVQTISASAEVEGSEQPSGIEISAEMEAPGGKGSSMGPETLPIGEGKQVKTLLEDLESVSASGVGLTYRISVSPEASAGSSSISVTYTVSES